MSEEQWRIVEGFEDYAVSDQGRIRRIIPLPRVKGDGFLKPVRTQWGYWQVRLFRQHKGYIRFLHRVVLEAFCPRPTPKHQCNHKDGDKANNILSNLEWVTSQENHMHRLEVLHQTSAHGEQLPQSKLTESDVIEIRRLHKVSGMNQRQIAERFGVRPDNISRIVNRYYWKHVE